MPRPAGARRDEGAYRQYVTEEQRSQAGCSAGRMQRDFHHGLLGSKHRVGPLLRIPVIRRLHDRQLLFPVVVVLVVSGVLLQGAWQRSDLPAETAGQADTPAPVSSPVSRRPDLEQTPLTYFDDYWRQLRERVGPDRTPAVVVMPGLALTSAEAAEAVLAQIERARLVRPPDRPPTNEGAAVALPGGQPPPIEAGVEDPAAGKRPVSPVRRNRDPRGTDRASPSRTRWCTSAPTGHRRSSSCPVWR